MDNVKNNMAYYKYKIIALQANYISQPHRSNDARALLVCTIDEPSTLLPS